MSGALEPVSASAQYNDFKGVVYIDEPGGPMPGAAGSLPLLGLLRRTAKVPKGYWPVGFCVSAQAGCLPCGLPGHTWSLTVYAVDADVAGATGSSLSEYFGQKTDVPVFRFRVPIEPSELMELFAQSVKRFRLLAQTRAIEDKRMVLVQDE